MASAWERRRAILDFTLSSLLRRKGKNAGLVLVFTSIVFLLASVMFLLHALRHEAAGVLAGSPEIVVQKMVAGRHELIPVEYAGRLRGLPGVQEVGARLWGYWYDPSTRANYTLLVPPHPEPAPGTIRIGAGIARTRELFPGDLLSLKAFDGEPLLLEVAEVLPADLELIATDLMLVGAGDFRALFGVPPGLATDLTLRVRNPREVETVALKVSRLLPDARVVLKSELLRTYDAIFDWRGGMTLVLLAGSVLAFLIFSWDKASGLSAEERREIGILKAIGWETSDVILLKLWEGAVVSLTSFFAGTVLAYAHVFLFGGTLLAPAMKGWSVLYPDFRLAPGVSPFELATLLFTTVLPYTAATVIPAWRAATVDPDAVMRSGS